MKTKQTAVKQLINLTKKLGKAITDLSDYTGVEK